MRGVLPVLQRHLLDIADARSRLLAPGGRLIPRTDTLWASVVETPKLWRSHMGPWEKRPEGFDLGSAKPFVANTWRKARVTARQLLTRPVRWARLDYHRLESAHVEGRARLRAGRRGVGHGLGLWFDADLAPGVRFSNAPGQPQLIYGQGYFPWPTPVALEKGDVVDVRLRADLVGDDYVWTWESSMKRRGRPGKVAVHFRQSTFLGTPLTPETLARRAANNRTRLGRDGLATRRALELMDGETPLAQIAADLESRFPGRFRTSAEALAFVADISSRFGE
jgi:protein arginine N-methyltransferase 1